MKITKASLNLLKVRKLIFKKRNLEKKLVGFSEELRTPQFSYEISWPSRNLYSKYIHDIYADQLLNAVILLTSQTSPVIRVHTRKKSKMTFAVQKSASIRILLLGLDTSNSDFKYQSKIFLNPIKVVNSHSLILKKFGKNVDRFWHADKDQTNWPKKHCIHCAQALKVRASRQASSSSLAFFSFVVETTIP